MQVSPCFLRFWGHFVFRVVLKWDCLAFMTPDQDRFSRPNQTPSGPGHLDQNRGRGRPQGGGRRGGARGGPRGGGRPAGGSGIVSDVPEDKEQAVELDGVVSAVLAGTMFRVKLRNGHEVLAHISGKMRKRFIRLVIGDQVKLEMSQYDTEKARIVYRL
jgi:translation initiation factor IF-1